MQQQLILIFSLLFISTLSFGQEKDSITQEEKERREKNIQSGNPFKKYGYTPKIATLSDGKYLEFHDLDSIVIIGSVYYNRITKKVVDFVERDMTNPDAQPLSDIRGRWLSPDPLSEEFNSWSPYNFVYNNPVKFVDPTGMAPEHDYKLLKNGEVQLIRETNDSSDTLYSTNEVGQVTSKSNSITVAKDSPTDTSIIGELSSSTSIGGMIGMDFGTLPEFSEGFTQNLEDAFNVFNFMNSNTENGIEFMLNKFSSDGNDFFQVSTSHSYGTEIKSNRFSNDNLVWSLHNHDGISGLQIVDVSNQWNTDRRTLRSLIKNNHAKGLGYPRMFTVNQANQLIEVKWSGMDYSNLNNYNTSFLSTLNREYSK